MSKLHRTLFDGQYSRKRRAAEEVMMTTKTTTTTTEQDGVYSANGITAIDWAANGASRRSNGSSGGSGSGSRGEEEVKEEEAEEDEEEERHQHGVKRVKFSDAVGIDDIVHPPALYMGAGQLGLHGTEHDEERGEQRLGLEAAKQCLRLMGRPHEHAPKVAYPAREFEDVCLQIATCKKTCVVYNILPVLVPSPDALWRSEGRMVFRLMAEERDARCMDASEGRMRGFRPSLAVGVAHDALSPHQRRRLARLRERHPRFHFSEHVQLPFLVVETRRPGTPAGEQIGEAGAILAAAVLELRKHCDAEYVANAEPLHGKILSFSVSHDNAGADLWAHYSVVSGGGEDQRPVMHRHLVMKADFERFGARSAGYFRDVVLEIYETFIYTHLSRVREMLDAMTAFDKASDARHGSRSNNAGNAQRPSRQRR